MTTDTLFRQMIAAKLRRAADAYERGEDSDAVALLSGVAAEIATAGGVDVEKAFDVGRAAVIANARAPQTKVKA